MRLLTAAAVALLAASAADARAQEPIVVVVANSAEYRALAWTIEERFRIGPAVDGPEAFFRVFPWTIATDRTGRIYVLDLGDSMVRVFGADGEFVREFGGRGGGPGEFVRPAGIAVRDDGTVVVSDIGKAGLVRFDSTGAPLPQVYPNIQLGSLGIIRDQLLVARGTPQVHDLLLLGPTDTTTLARTAEPGMITYPDCPMSVPGAPLFAPEVHWSSDGSSLAIHSGPDYEVRVLDGRRTRHLIKREVEPIQIDRRDALDSRQARNGFRVKWPGNQCEVDPEGVVEARGFAKQVSPVTAVSSRPGGQVWVERQLELEGPTRIDVFGADGHYLGTLPEGIPFPITWQSANAYISSGFSDVGVPFVVALRVIESTNQKAP